MNNFGLFSIMASGTRTTMAQIANLGYTQSDVRILYRPDQPWQEGESRYAQFHRITNPRQVERSLVVPLRDPHKSLMSKDMEYSGFDLYNPMLLMMANFIGFCKIAETLGTPILYLPIGTSVTKEQNWDRLCDFVGASRRPYPKDDEIHVGHTGKGQRLYAGAEVPWAVEFYEERVQRVKDSLR